MKNYDGSLGNSGNSFGDLLRAAVGALALAAAPACAVEQRHARQLTPMLDPIAATRRDLADQLAENLISDCLAATLQVANDACDATRLSLETGSVQDLTSTSEIRWLDGTFSPNVGAECGAVLNACLAHGTRKLAPQKPQQAR